MIFSPILSDSAISARGIVKELSTDIKIRLTWSFSLKAILVGCIFHSILFPFRRLEVIISTHNENFHTADLFELSCFFSPLTVTQNVAKAHAAKDICSSTDLHVTHEKKYESFVFSLSFVVIVTFSSSFTGAH